MLRTQEWSDVDGLLCFFEDRKKERESRTHLLTATSNVFIIASRSLWINDEYELAILVRLDIPFFFLCPASLHPPCVFSHCFTFCDSLRNGIFTMSWQSIFDKEILRPIGLGLSYVSAMKETMDIEFQDKRIRVAQREAEGEENIGLVVWDVRIFCLFRLTWNSYCNHVY